MKLFGPGKDNKSPSSIKLLFSGLKNLQKLIAFDFKIFFFIIDSEIFNASFPDNLIIAMPEGPLPDERA